MRPPSNPRFYDMYTWDFSWCVLGGWREALCTNIKHMWSQFYYSKGRRPSKATVFNSRSVTTFLSTKSSTSLFDTFAEPSNTKLSSALFHGWKQGLKTGMYYLRSKPATEAIKFTVDETLLGESDGTPNSDDNDNDDKTNTFKCDEENGVCLMCSS